MTLVGIEPGQPGQKSNALPLRQSVYSVTADSSTLRIAYRFISNPGSQRSIPLCSGLSDQTLN